MKKLIAILLNLLLIFNTISCNANKYYKDGLFVGIGEPYTDGNDDCTIAISEGRISDITLRHFDSNGEEINYDEWTGKPVNGIINSNLKEYRGDFIEEVLEAQTYDIKSIDEIPIISNNWKLALKRALDQAKK